MELATSFLVYALLFRLAIIATGAACVVLGYKLFVLGVMRKGDTSAGAEFGTIKLTVSNAAPGTCFALFGAAIIIAMLVQGNPELALETAEGATRSDGEPAPSTTRVNLKGSGSQRPEIATPTSYADLVEEAKRLAILDKPTEALSAYQTALTTPGLLAIDGAVAMVGMAGLYLERGQSVKAEILAKLAATIDPSSPRYFDTIAQALLAHGNSTSVAEAVQAASHAVSLDQSNAGYHYTLARTQEASQQFDAALSAMRKAAQLDPRYLAELERLGARDK